LQNLDDATDRISYFFAKFQPISPILIAHMESITLL